MDVKKYINDFIPENMRYGKKIVFWGTGSSSKELSEYWSMAGLDPIKFYIDNDRAKHGSKFMGSIVVSSEKIKEEEYDDYLILSVNGYYEEIAQQLIKMGFLEGRHFLNGEILWWKLKMMLLGEKYLDKVNSGLGNEMGCKIKRQESVDKTSVDQFWNEYVVCDLSFDSIEEHLGYLEHRYDNYPFSKEFMQLYSKHDGETILEYGCGPGEDLIGFLIFSNAYKVIGIDVSAKALTYAKNKVELYNIDFNRVELIQIIDSVPKVPLLDQSVDHINCNGVLQHVTNDIEVLKEFYRVLKPGKSVNIMVYNPDSIFFHIGVPYVVQILENRYIDLDVNSAFSKLTDREDCPIARTYRSQDFIGICDNIGFTCEFIGGHFTLPELKVYEKYSKAALLDERLSDEHKNFIRELTVDENNFPMYKGKYAGYGGVYRLKK